MSEKEKIRAGEEGGEGDEFYTQRRSARTEQCSSNYIIIYILEKKLNITG